MECTFEAPIKVISEMNWRGHWAERYSRLKNQKGITYAYCLKNIGCKPTDESMEGEFKITLTRIKGHAQRDYDTDNLASSFKAVRDGIAQYLGIDDGDKRLTWEYRQEKSSAPGIRVSIVQVLTPIVEREWVPV